MNIFSYREVINLLIFLSSSLLPGSPPYASFYIDKFANGREEITAKVNPGSQIRTNPLRVWIEDNLQTDPVNTLHIGALKQQDSTTLFGNYLKWSHLHSAEIGSIKPNQFSTLLLDTFNSLNWKVTKKRMSTGTVIMGIKFKEVNQFTHDSKETVKPKPLDFDIYDDSNLETLTAVTEDSNIET